ncbi:hypothetical protein Tcan_03315 [Toxocara canis]|uniref:Uncharacterized protein n=1 Tax=Toxocara canis TaxID=6265 RepID=A0A0B2VY03_TOXCA|nr:hypothetical protein Tcan_03315 [Toxocara canis]
MDERWKVLADGSLSTGPQGFFMSPRYFPKMMSSSPYRSPSPPQLTLERKHKLKINSAMAKHVVECHSLQAVSVAVKILARSKGTLIPKKINSAMAKHVVECHSLQAVSVAVKILARSKGTLIPKTKEASLINSRKPLIH